ncbi:hypothetical protein ACWGR4_13425 [Embleya sp. NPDC055664]
MAAAMVALGITWFIVNWEDASRGQSVVSSLIAVIGVVLLLLAFFPHVPTGKEVGAVAVATVMVLGAAVALPGDGDGVGDGSKGPASGCPKEKQAWYRNPVKMDGLPVDSPVVCSVNINEGNKVGQAYRLSGVVVGEIPPGKTLVIETVSSKESCNALGDRGTGQYIFNTKVSTGPWTVDFTLPNRDDLPLKRTHFFVLMSTVEADKRSEAQKIWQNATGRTHGYPGEPASSGTTLYTLDIQPELEGDMKRPSCKPN